MEDKTHSEYSHIGWIPCISGHLFFKYTSCGLGTDSVVIETNYLEKHGKTYTRHVIVSSVVDWKDHDGGGRPPRPLNGEYRVTLLSRFEPYSEQIKGTVFILPNAQVQKDYASVNKHICNIRTLSKKGENINQEYERLHSALLESQLSYEVAFQLTRKGFIYLKFINKQSNQDAETTETVVRQAYYYAKYSWHKHKHHSDTAESLTRAHRISSCKPNIGMALITDLKDSLVTLKRNFHISDHQGLSHSKGITSYANSLILSCHRQGLIKISEKDIQLSYFENISASLQVSGQLIEKDISTRNTIANNFRAMLLFILAIVAPITIIFREDIRDLISDDAAKDLLMPKLISSIVASNTKLLIFIGLLLSAFYLYRKMHLKFGSYFIANAWFRDFLDSIVREKRKAYILSVVTIIISVIMILSSIKFLLR